MNEALVLTKNRSPEASHLEHGYNAADMLVRYPSARQRRGVANGEVKWRIML